MPMRLPQLGVGGGFRSFGNCGIIENEGDIGVFGANGQVNAVNPFSNTQIEEGKLWLSIPSTCTCQ